MKKLLFILVCLLVITGTSRLYATPDAALIKSFHIVFPGAENTTWHEDEDGYLAHFNQSEVTLKARYNKQGNLIYVMRYYADENILPLNVLLSVKKKYPGKKVYGITEYSGTSGIVYNIRMEDELNWYDIKATMTGKVHMQERLKKLPS
jgi:hypothetical protein